MARESSMNRMKQRRKIMAIKSRTLQNRTTSGTRPQPVNHNADMSIRQDCAEKKHHLTEHKSPTNAADKTFLTGCFGTYLP